MSIYGSLDAPSDDEHEEGCAYYKGWGGDSLEFSGKPCDCGQPSAPLVYQGSHVLPEAGDKRGGDVDIALISAHVRYWREHPDAPSASEPDSDTHPPEPFLRFGVNEGRVVLDVAGVQRVATTLNEWLEAIEKGGYK